MSKVQEIVKSRNGEKGGGERQMDHMLALHSSDAQTHTDTDTHTPKGECDVINVTTRDF